MPVAVETLSKDINPARVLAESDDLRTDPGDMSGANIVHTSQSDLPRADDSIVPAEPVIEASESQQASVANSEEKVQQAGSLSNETAIDQHQIARDCPPRAKAQKAEDALAPAVKAPSTSKDAEGATAAAEVSAVATDQVAEESRRYQVGRFLHIV